MCKCVETTNAALKDHNAILVTNLIGTQRASLFLTKGDEKRRGRLPILQAIFCPFCGEKYPEMKAATAIFEGHTA